jgi:2-C-methyl-D-erythritol 2,4-cyclodiphosphate synthase/2-C-methyl-D-erythritol 4-phosphate cytidylyltransferase
LLWRVLSRFEANPLVADIVLVLRPQDIDYCRREILEPGGFAKIRSIVPGGVERRESVYLGLQQTTADMVLIHDAVRPFFSDALISRVVDATREHGAALPGLQVVETIKHVEEGRVVATPLREKLWRAQTPQGFDRHLLQRAHDMAAVADVEGITDDAMLVERLGHDVHIVPGEADNLKITTPQDLVWAEWAMREKEPVMAAGSMRIGQGYDVHRLVEGRALVLGGVVVPFELGLAGHSDADVLTHAIIDALLGALSAGDIGQLFPDTDAQYKDISSLVLLEQVHALMAERGAQLNHIDAVVMAQRPKLAPYIDGMRKVIADTLQVEKERISLKATTTEQLGFVGREEGMAAQAVALLEL